MFQYQVICFLSKTYGSLASMQNGGWLIPVSLYNQRMSTKIRNAGTSILFFMTGVVLLVVSSWPLPRHSITLAFPPAYSLDHPDQKAVKLDREIEISIPLKMRIGQPGIVRLASHPVNLTMDSTNVWDENASYLLEARLEIPGLKVDPADSILQPVNEDIDLQYSWNIQAIKKGTWSGTLWIYLLVPGEGNQKIDRRPVQALPFEIDVIAFPFINSKILRMIALACIMAAGFILLWKKYLGR